MSTADAPDCALCELKATARCSGCKAISFCGAQCQRTVWPVHKTLCKAEPGVFRQAPLTTKEMADLQDLAEHPYDYRGSAPAGYPEFSVKQVLLTTCGSDDWSWVCRRLQSPSTDPGPANHFDDVREDGLIMARDQLAIHYDYAKEVDPRPPPATTPWLELAMLLPRAGVLYNLRYNVLIPGNEYGHPVHPTSLMIRQLNPFFRQVMIETLVVHQIYKARTAAEAMQWMPLLFLAQQRSLAILDGLDLDYGIRTDLRALASSRYASMAALAREEGMPSRALHP